MKSLHELFDEFQKEVYPDVGPTAVLAMRRAFVAGYAAQAEHVHEMLHTSDPKEAMGKVMALMMSVDSFDLDCKEKE